MPENVRQISDEFKQRSARGWTPERMAAPAERIKAGFYDVDRETPRADLIRAGYTPPETARHLRAAE